MKLGIVKADYNERITDEMLKEAREKADELGISILEELNVPGAFDAPLAADRLARRQEIDAVVVIGAIIKGDTDHDQIIGSTVADKISQISINRDTPVLLSVTGPGMTAEEAKDRTHYAAQGVESAKRMVEELE